MLFTSVCIVRVYCIIMCVFKKEQLFLMFESQSLLLRESPGHPHFFFVSPSCSFHSFWLNSFVFVVFQQLIIHLASLSFFFLFLQKEKKNAYPLFSSCFFSCSFVFYSTSSLKHLYTYYTHPHLNPPSLSFLFSLSFYILYISIHSSCPPFFYIYLFFLSLFHIYNDASCLIVYFIITGCATNTTIIGLSVRTSRIHTATFCHRIGTPTNSGPVNQYAIITKLLGLCVCVCVFV